jgi:hypothetical protein
MTSIRIDLDDHLAESLRRLAAERRGRVIATSETGLAEGVASYWKDRGVAGVAYDVAEPDPAKWRTWHTWRRDIHAR